MSYITSISSQMFVQKDLITLRNMLMENFSFIRFAVKWLPLVQKPSCNTRHSLFKILARNLSSRNFLLVACCTLSDSARQVM